MLQRQSISTLQLILSAVILLGCTHCPASAQSGVAIDPTRLTVEQGTSATVTCTLSDDVIGTRTWLDPSGSVTSQRNDSLIYFNPGDGTLVFVEPWVNDTGDYTCALNYTATAAGGGAGCDAATTGIACNATIFVNVYEMPDYFSDGMIVLAINLVLGSIFVVCLVRAAVVDRRRLRKYRQKL